MGKPDITLEPSKGVVSEMSAMIFSAYIIRGEVKKGEEKEWMERSIREAVRIAKTVEASIETEDLPAADKEASRPNGNTPKSSAGESAPSDLEPPPGSEEATANSELDAVIDDALSEEDTPIYRTKNE